MSMLDMAQTFKGIVYDHYDGYPHAQTETHVECYHWAAKRMAYSAILTILPLDGSSDL